MFHCVGTIHTYWAVIDCWVQNRIICCWVNCSLGRGFLQKILFAEAQSRLQNFDHTSKSVILWPITIYLLNCCMKHTILNKLGAFLAKFAPNFVNWAHWVWNGNPPIDINQKLRKIMFPKTFQHPRIPSTSVQWVSPSRPHAPGIAEVWATF